MCVNFNAFALPDQHLPLRTLHSDKRILIAHSYLSYQMHGNIICYCYQM